MRVNKTETFPALNILHSHVFEECRLTHTGLSYYIGVTVAVLLFDTERRALIASVSKGKIRYLLEVIGTVRFRRELWLHSSQYN
jgi:hypothetical protein